VLAINILILINALVLCIWAWSISDAWFPGIKMAHHDLRYEQTTD
jgi:hypothetical protein